MSRKHSSRGQALAAQAWENLSQALESAGDGTRTARRRAAGLVDDASDRVGYGAKRVGSGAKEARRRAHDAVDALAGRRRTPWGLVAGGLAVGAMLGWIISTFGRGVAPSRWDALTPDGLADLADTPADLLGPRR